MKKSLVAAIAAIMSLAPASNAQAKAKLGIKGGLNVTSMSLSKKVFDADNKMGFFIGPTLKFSLPLTNLGIDASALYDQREAKVTGEVGNEQIVIEERSMKTKYINIPINLRYSIGLGSLASIYFFGGPQFGFNVGDKSQELVDGATWRLKSSAFSVNLGAGLTLGSHLQLSANHNIACGHTGDVTLGSATSDIFGSKKGRANAWQIGLAYYF